MSDDLERTGKKGEGRDLVILMCGDRNWGAAIMPWQKITNVLLKHNPYKIIEGEARGADAMSRTVAEDMDISVDRFPANWAKYGRAAGPIRNTEMLKRLLWYRDEHGYDIMVVAFHPDITQSKGTKNMVKQAEKAGVEVEIVT